MSPFLAVFVCLSLCSVLVHGQNETTLKGITVLRAPFVEQDVSTGKLKGFFVDLLDELAQIGNFKYTLTSLNMPATAASTGLIESTPNGLINELYRHHADFAIADYLTKSNPRYVDYTISYLTSGFSALVDKNRLTANNIGSFEELFDQNLVKPKNADDTGEKIALGTIRPTASYRQLSLAKGGIGLKVYHWLYNNNYEVDTREQGVTRALTEPFALVQETINNELALDEHCELTQLLLTQFFPNGTNEGIVFEYSIAVQKVSKYLPILDQGIRELKANGRLDELRRRYWNRKCNGSHSDKVHYLLTLVSLSISLFLLS